MRPLKFIEVSAIKAVQMEGVILCSTLCQECLESFRENARLVLGLAAAPGFSALVTAQFVEAGTKAAIEVLGKKYIRKLPGVSATDSERIVHLADKHMALIVSERSPLQRSQLEDATNTLEQLVMRCGPYVHGMFEGVLKTIVIQSWGTFEALTRMLWAKSLESGNPVISRPTEKEWRRERLGFGSRSSIRRTFDFGFRVDNSDICSALNVAAIDPLAVLRNVIVHHAGRVDQVFKDDSDGFPVLASYRAQSLDTLIEVDGVLVRSVVDPVISSGYSLIRAVDSWLSSHQ